MSQTSDDDNNNNVETSTVLNATISADIADGGDFLLLDNKFCESLIKCDAYMVNLNKTPTFDDDNELVVGVDEMTTTNIDDLINHLNFYNQNNNAIEDQSQSVKNQKDDKTTLVSSSKNDQKSINLLKLQKNNDNWQYTQILTKTTGGQTPKRESRDKKAAVAGNTIKITTSGLSSNMQTTITPNPASSSTSSSSTTNKSVLESQSSTSSSTVEDNKSRTRLLAPKYSNTSEIRSDESSSSSTDDNIKTVVTCLKEFYVETNRTPFGLLMNTLKSYTLGTKDELKCILCCIERFDLSGFIRNHSQQKIENEVNLQSTSTIMNSNKFCNAKKLEDIAKYVSLFNPFCDEYCKRFYPECGKPSTNIQNNINNNCYDKAPPTPEISVQKPAKFSIKCRPIPKIPSLTQNFTKLINFNNNADSLHAGLNSNKNSYSNFYLNPLLKSLTTIDSSTITTLTTNKVDNLIGCLRDFDLLNAKETYENNKKTILNFNQQEKTTANKMKCISSELLKYKPIPLCRDTNGNLVFNIDLNRSLSKRPHNLTSNILISNRNSKISSSSKTKN